jgi:hypothetical protein
LLGPDPRLIKKEFTGPRSNKVWETLQWDIIVRIITKKKSRKITWTEKRFSGQNRKNTNSRTKKNNTARNLNFNKVTAKRPASTSSAVPEYVSAPKDRVWLNVSSRFPICIQ